MSDARIRKAHLVCVKRVEVEGLWTGNGRIFSTLGHASVRAYVGRQDYSRQHMTTIIEYFDLVEDEEPKA